MAKPWFRPKIFGWGASPASWEGWAATGVLVVLMIADIRFVPRLFADRPMGLVLGVAIAAALLAAFAFLTLAKGGGPWKWRWGGDD